MEWMKIHKNELINETIAMKTKQKSSICSNDHWRMLELPFLGFVGGSTS